MTLQCSTRMPDLDNMRLRREPNEREREVRVLVERVLVCWRVSKYNSLGKYLVIYLLKAIISSTLENTESISSLET